jgi:phosphoribosylanthranilate isomerase
MTWVKICGMTNLEDALAAVDAGADAVGFVFYEKSPRRISVEAAREIAEKLPASVEKIGVFVNESANEITRIADLSGLSALQVYPKTSGKGRLSFNSLQELEHRTFVAIPGERLTAGQGFETFLSRKSLSRISALFLDAGNQQQPGGTGKVFDWESAAQSVKAASKLFPIVIAGGLTPNNVADAMRILKPWGVDVASGVEARPGKKDPEKVRAFVKAVRDAEAKS